jgi:hypothetical protein
LIDAPLDDRDITRRECELRGEIIPVGPPPAITIAWFMRTTLRLQRGVAASGLVCDKNR